MKASTEIKSFMRCEIIKEIFLLNQTFYAIFFNEIPSEQSINAFLFRAYSTC